MRRLAVLIPWALTGLALLVAPASAPAQSCGVQPGTAVVAAGSYVSHAVAGGTSGYSVGADVVADVATPAGAATVQAGYRKMLLEGEAADPDLLRARISYPALVVAGVQICGDGHAAGSRFSLPSGTGAVLAGGVGLTAAGTVGVFRPYLSVRGLGAWTTGTVLGADLSAAGLAVGVAGGVAADLGAVTVRVAGARDGFDDGLGATPYPNTAVELTVGYRF